MKAALSPSLSLTHTFLSGARRPFWEECYWWTLCASSWRAPAPNTLSHDTALGHTTAAVWLVLSPASASSSLCCSLPVFLPASSCLLSVEAPSGHEGGCGYREACSQHAPGEGWSGQRTRYHWNLAFVMRSPRFRSAASATIYFYLKKCKFLFKSCNGSILIPVLSHCSFVGLLVLCLRSALIGPPASTGGEGRSLAAVVQRRRPCLRAPLLAWARLETPHLWCPVRLPKKCLQCVYMLFIKGRIISEAFLSSRVFFSFLCEMFFALTHELLWYYEHWLNIHLLRRYC